MNNNINIELRKNILESSLQLEAATKELIKNILQITQPKLKSLGNRTSSFSFKNKIDLLNDLEILNDSEYKSFLLFMEYRNQFIHNINCVSFLKATEFLGKDKRNKLLKHNDLKNSEIDEFVLKSSFDNLFLTCLDIILTKTKDHSERIKNIGKPYKTIFAITQEILYNDGKLLMSLLNSCSDINKSESEELIKFKMEIGNKIIDHNNKIRIKETFAKLNGEIERLDSKEINFIYRNSKTHYS